MHSVTLKRRTFLKTTGVTLSAAAQACATNSERTKPNILFIMTDQQFADVMSNRMGTRYINTPAMDSLAKTGIIFTQAYTPNPLCVPARNAIFTGRYPHETGVQSNRKATLDPDEFPLMGKYFKQAGYNTGYVGKWHISTNIKDNKTHGFDFIEVNYGKGHDDQIPKPAIDFLKKKRDNPFLLTVSITNPHDVCQLARHQKLPSGPIGEAPPIEERPPLPPNALPPKNESDTMSLMRESYHNDSKFPVGDYDEDKWRRLRWGYYRLVEKADALIGKILDAVKQNGLQDNTLIIFTSDHGDCHGAHGFNQKTVFYEESTRIPLILSYKNVINQGASNLLINTGIDILPTMLDYAGIEQPKKLPGKSLRNIAEGKPQRQWRDFVVVQNYMTQGGPVDGETPKVQGRMVRSKKFKYCLFDLGKRRQELYDMKNDILETINLADDSEYAKVITEHRNYLKQHATKHNDSVALKMLAHK